MKLSVILPTYNEANWLPETITKLDTSITTATDIKAAEIIIIDDGSSDGTKEIVRNLQTKTPIVYIQQKNSGRFLARSAGIIKAKNEFILFIDSRVHIHPNSLKHVAAAIKKDPSKIIWNAHVHVAKEGNVFARFWDAITFIAWRKYFANPREVSYGLKDFDYYPKGTTCFIAPTSLVKEAIKNFSTKTNNLKSANDDTLMIKYFAAKSNIHISPQFCCTYHSRSTMQKFLNHAYHRGRVFVDGFLRRDGNRYFWPLVLFLVLTATAPFLIYLLWDYMPYIALALGSVWLSLLLVALMLKVAYKDALALFGLAPLFTLTYGFGIWHAVIQRVRTKV